MFFRDADRSLRSLSDLSGDDGLRSGIEDGTVGSQIIEDHGTLKGLPQVDLPLSFAIGDPETELCRRYLIDTLTLSTIHAELHKRYPLVFEWLKAFREKAGDRGFVSVNGRRKYLQGLQSSNVFVKRKAMNRAIRWAIRY